MNSEFKLRIFVLILALVFVGGFSSAEEGDAGVGEMTWPVGSVVIADASWEDEWVLISNLGEFAQDFTGWTLKDAQDHIYDFPEGFVLGPGETVTVHTRVGDDTATDLYWNLGSPVWNNAGDVATLMDDEGNIVSQYPEPEGDLDGAENA